MSETRNLTSLKIHNDGLGVQIEWNINEQQYGNVVEGLEDDPESIESTHDFYVNGKHAPHKDLSSSMVRLRKHALEICDIEVDSKTIGTWGVNKISISGSVELQTARVVMTVTKRVKKTGKIIEFKTPQVTMFPQEDEEHRYHNAEALTVVIQDIIEEAWMFLAGKYAEDDFSQLKLFPDPKVRTMKAPQRAQA